MNHIEVLKKALGALDVSIGLTDLWGSRYHGMMVNAYDALKQAIAEMEKQRADSEHMEPAALKVIHGEICYKSQDNDQSFGMWCPVSYDSAHGFETGTVFYTTAHGNKGKA